MREPVPTPRFRQILLRATAYAQTRREDYVGVEHLLAAIIEEDQSLAAHALRASGARDQVLTELLALMDGSRPDGQ